MVALSLDDNKTNEDGNGKEHGKNSTVKLVLSGHRIKRIPSIKRIVAEVPKFISLIYLKWNLY